MYQISTSNNAVVGERRVYLDVWLTIIMRRHMSGRTYIVGECRDKDSFKERSLNRGVSDSRYA